MSRFHDFLETVSWWDDRPAGPLSTDERSAIAEEAAHWFVMLEGAGLRERAQFLKWARRSPHHLTAYFDTVRIDAQLKSTVDAASVHIREPPDPWSNLKKHPLAIVVAAVLFTGGIVWTVSDNVRVRPATQRIEELERQVAELRSRMPADQGPPKSAIGGAPKTAASAQGPRSP